MPPLPKNKNLFILSTIYLTLTIQRNDLFLIGYMYDDELLPFKFSD